MKSSNKPSFCFVDTKNLDGEINLKEKSCLKDFENLDENKIFQEFQGTISFDFPSSNLNTWEGNIDYHGRKIHSRLKNFLLKGCIEKY